MPAPNKKSKKAATQTTAQPAETKRVSWPSLDPLCPKEDLSLRDVVPGQIITISNFWTSALCKKYVNFLNGLPLTTTPGVPKRGEATRVNDRFQIDDPEFAQTLWSATGLKDLVTQATTDAGGQEQGAAKQQLWGGDVLGLNPNIRIYRYRKGQFFDQHYDDSNTLNHPGPPSTAARTTWTLLLYLTSPATGCLGGETVFYPDDTAAPSKKGGESGGKKNQQPQEPVVVGLETGMALLHRHGRDCMLHEGREVLGGEKWVIRSDLCVKR